MHLVVGVVAEGPTDVVVFDEYLSTWIRELDDSVTLEVRPLQPAVDATSGRFGYGGWTWVKAWCESNPPEVRTFDLFEPLFEDEPPVDVLLVQLGRGRGRRLRGRVCGHHGAAEPGCSRERHRSSQRVLERWLWNSTDRRHADPHGGRHCLVATVRALETWLVAGLDPSIPEPEEIENPEQELMNIEPGLRTKRDGHVGRLRKNREEVADAWLEKDTYSNWTHIKAVCPHCEQFLSYFETAIEQGP